MKKEKGITLVALVVTIVVLIILAGVSIHTLIGEDGIITVAKQAKENIELAQVEEQENLNTLYGELVNSLAFSSTDTGDTTDSELQNKFDTLKAEYDALQAEHDTLQTNYTDLQTEYDNFRTDIANAITEKGISTDANDSSSIMVENIQSIGGSEIIKLGTVSFSGTGAINYSNSKTFDVASKYDDYANLTIDNFIDMTGSAGKAQAMNNWVAAGDATASINSFSYNATTGVLTIRYTSYAYDSAALGSTLTIPIYIVV